MNKQCSCTATITDQERKKRLEGIFENDDIPIRVPIPVGVAETPHHGEYQFYEVDKSRITEEQKYKIAERLAPVFNLTLDEIVKDFDNPDFKVPLRSDSCIVSWCAMHSRLVL